MTWKLNLFSLRGELEKEARWATHVTAKDRSRQTFLFLLLKIASPCGIKAKKKRKLLLNQPPHPLSAALNQKRKVTTKSNKVKCKHLSS
jgi:hypothetical protein